MKLLVVNILFLLTSTILFGQIEKEKVKLVIPADTSAIAPPSDLPRVNENKEDKSYFSLSRDPNLKRPEPLINMGPDIRFGETSNLLRAGEGMGLEQRINKQIQKPEDENMAALKRNQFLGDIKTRSKRIKIVYRDHQLEDGDMVKLIINDVVVQGNIVLSNISQGVEVELEEGFNKVDFQALNQGTSGPNTAEFRVYDGSGQLLSAKQWNLATGYKASMIVVKEGE